MGLCPKQESNWQPFREWDDTQPTELLQPVFFFKNKYSIFHFTIYLTSPLLMVNLCCL